MLHARILHYALLSLEGAPDVFDRLLLHITPAELDARPDPDRFTLREAMAHLADWEGVFLERMTATHSSHNATLQGYDEGQWALDHDYAHSDIDELRAKFRAGREKLVAFLRSLTDTDWQRTGQHTEIGPVTLEAQTLLVLAHDGYHARQVAEFRTRLS